METLEMDVPHPNTNEHISSTEQDFTEEEEDSPIEEVRLTVKTTDDPTLPVWTFRMWFLGLFSCGLLSFLNQFFAYRTYTLYVAPIAAQVAIFPLGHFLAAALPTAKFKIPGFGSSLFSFNPGPFNVKEHVLISVFANAGNAYGNGSAYALGVVTIAKAFYKRKMSFLAGWLLIISTQLRGYSWAGLLINYVVEPAHMWWPSSLAQVSLFQALHEKDEQRLSRAKFFLIALVCSFSWYIVPGYLFTTLTSISWLCWMFSNSVTLHQIGSGLSGFGIGAFTLDWTAVSYFFDSPLLSPFFVIINISVGYLIMIYILIPVAYWRFDLYGTRRFPMFSTQLFTAQGQIYNVSEILDDKLELDLENYQKQGKIHLSTFFVLSYGLSFAAVASTLTHVGCFYGREIYSRFWGSFKVKEDIHTRLMRRYQDIPSSWFYIIFGVTMVASLILSIFLESQVEMPWWGVLLASTIAFIFTLPTSIITATTNQTPGLNVVTEYVMGMIYPGKPIANVCFKTYGYKSMGQAVFFLGDFKLGHYMKIPPRSMFIVQIIGTIIAGTINMAVAWWLLTSIENICQDDLLPPHSPWTCPTDRVFFNASILWGLLGTRENFGTLGNYGSMNWFFLIGALGPLAVWLFHKAFPKQSWIPLINLPVLLGAMAMPPATPLNYNAWIVVGTIFNYFIFHCKKMWWQRYNYILSGALDAGVAFMGVLLQFFVGMDKAIDWWGTKGEHCKLAKCPTAKGIVVDGCPVN